MKDRVRTDVARGIRPAGDLLVFASAAVIFLAQQIAISELSPAGRQGAIRQVLFFSTTGVLALLPLYFRRLWGAWLISAGILLNMLPMAFHHGSMPIDIEILERSNAFPDVTRAEVGKQTNHGKDVVLEREDIHLYALSDRFVVELPVYGKNIYSIGDFVLFAGVAAVVVQVLVQPLVERRSRPRERGGNEAA